MRRVGKCSRAVLLHGRTPSVDGRPSVSRRWATEPFPKSGKLSNASSDVSRTSPTVFRPAAISMFCRRAGNRTRSTGVSSGNSGVGSSIFRSLICPSPSALGVPTASQGVQDLLSALEISQFPETRYGGPGPVEACEQYLVASPPSPPAPSVSPPSFLRLEPELDQAADGFGAWGSVFLLSCPGYNFCRYLRREPGGHRGVMTGGRPPSRFFVCRYCFLHNL